MPSFSLPKSTKILPKTEPRSHQFFDRFLDGFFIHFSSNLGPNLGPSWSHVGHFSRPRRFQDASKTLPRRLLGRSWAENGASGYNSAPTWLQTSMKIEVWRGPGQVWRPLGPSWAIQRIFEGILDRLGGVMEASWAGKVANMAPTWPQVGA